MSDVDPTADKAVTIIIFVTLIQIIIAIYINEVLSFSNRAHYVSIKDTAVKLGFKYVWHSAGKILVKWKDNVRAHLIRTI